MKKILLCASAFALLLGSCSKDDAEVAPVDVQGKLAFSAAMTIGNDTRTGAVVEGGDLKYTWDLGDMVGATVKNLSEVVPFINQNTDEGSKTANFYYSSEDFKYLGGEEVFLAYPYEKDNKVDAGGNINMTIPENQRYRDDSFAPMTAPAVAYVPNFEEGAEYTFRAVSSFIRVPVIGSGSVSKIEMQIKTSASALDPAQNRVPLCASPQIRRRGNCLEGLCEQTFLAILFPLFLYGTRVYGVSDGDEAGNSGSRRSGSAED